MAGQSKGAARAAPVQGRLVWAAVRDIIGYPAAVRPRVTTSRSRARTTSFCGFGRRVADPSVIARNPAWQEALNDGTFADKTTP